MTGSGKGKGKRSSGKGKGKQKPARQSHERSWEERHERQSQQEWREESYERVECEPATPPKLSLSLPVTPRTGSPSPGAHTPYGIEPIMPSMAPSPAYPRDGDAEYSASQQQYCGYQQGYYQMQPQMCSTPQYMSQGCMQYAQAPAQFAPAGYVQCGGYYERDQGGAYPYMASPQMQGQVQNISVPSPQGMVPYTQQGLYPSSPHDMPNQPSPGMYASSPHGMPSAQQGMVQLPSPHMQMQQMPQEPHQGMQQMQQIPQEAHQGMQQMQQMPQEAHQGMQMQQPQPQMQPQMQPQLQPQLQLPLQERQPVHQPQPLQQTVMQTQTVEAEEKGPVDHGGDWSSPTASTREDNAETTSQGSTEEHEPPPRFGYAEVVAEVLPRVGCGQSVVDAFQLPTTQEMLHELAVALVQAPAADVRALADLVGMLVFRAPGLTKEVPAVIQGKLAAIESDTPPECAHGVVVLAAQLFAQNVLPMAVMKALFMALLFSRPQPLDHSVLLCCHALLACGPTLERSEVGHRMVEYVILRLKELKGGKYTAETRQGITEICELRNYHWVNRSGYGELAGRWSKLSPNARGRYRRGRA